MRIDEERMLGLSGKPQRLQVSLTNRQIAMLDRLAVDMRVKHAAVVSRAGLLRAIVEAAERANWAADLFGAE